MPTAELVLSEHLTHVPGGQGFTPGHYRGTCCRPKESGVENSNYVALSLNSKKPLGKHPDNGPDNQYLNTKE